MLRIARLAMVSGLAGLSITACSGTDASEKSGTDVDNKPAAGNVEFRLVGKSPSEQFGAPACKLEIEYRNGLDQMVRLNVTNAELMANGEPVGSGFTSPGIPAGESRQDFNKYAGDCSELKNFKMREVLCEVMDENFNKVGSCDDELVLSSHTEISINDLRRP